ncbi:MAG: amino acid ABC transporter permease, partial [Rhodobacteraceae bacterium]|nr:amino acid ABC transporter permease [Paracoccaceae bacterium]
VRFGQFDETLDQEIGVRSAASTDHAVELLTQGDQVSGALLPAELAPADKPVLWETSFLPARYQLPAVALLVGGLLLSLLTFSAWQHGRHPLSVSA